VKAPILRTNGAEEQFEGDYTALRTAIHAEITDNVNLRDGRYMLVNDVGYALELDTNMKATKLYWSICKPGTTHQIVGDVAVYKPEEDKDV
jgi:hypothetical protein